MNRIVWLVSWYPSRVDRYLGDFIERHAQCASRYNSIFVICTVKDPSLRFRIQKEKKRYSETLTATIYYYPHLKFLGKTIDKLFSFLCSGFLPLVCFISYRFKYGKPKCVHIFVSWKAGLAALLIKNFFKTPYAVFERWTIFLPGALPNIEHFPKLDRFLINQIFKHSTIINTTSHHFAGILQSRYKKPVFVIPNVIVPETFYYRPKPVQVPFRFMHASTLDYQKNVVGMLQAFSTLREEGFDCELFIYGPERNYTIPPTAGVYFGGEVPHAQIAAAMQGSDALLLFSRYETFGNVVIEAQACGLPVITSDHPVFNETVAANSNGLKAVNENVADLAAKMKELMQHYHRFDKQKIAETAFLNYNPEHIGKRFLECYDHF